MGVSCTDGNGEVLVQGLGPMESGSILPAAEATGLIAGAGPPLDTYITSPFPPPLAEEFQGLEVPEQYAAISILTYLEGMSDSLSGSLSSSAGQLQTKRGKNLAGKGRGLREQGEDLMNEGRLLQQREQQATDKAGKSEGLALAMQAVSNALQRVRDQLKGAVEWLRGKSVAQRKVSADFTGEAHHLANRERVLRLVAAQKEREGMTLRRRAARRLGALGKWGREVDWLKEILIGLIKRTDSAVKARAAELTGNIRNMLRQALGKGAPLPSRWEEAAFSPLDSRDLGGERTRVTGIHDRHGLMQTVHLFSSSLGDLPQYSGEILMVWAKIQEIVTFMDREYRQNRDETDRSVQLLNDSVVTFEEGHELYRSKRFVFQKGQRSQEQAELQSSMADETLREMTGVAERMRASLKSGEEAALLGTRFREEGVSLSQQALRKIQEGVSSLREGEEALRSSQSLLFEGSSYSLRSRVYSLQSRVEITFSSILWGAAEYLLSA